VKGGGERGGERREERGERRERVCWMDRGRRGQPQSHWLTLSSGRRARAQEGTKSKRWASRPAAIPGTPYPRPVLEADCCVFWNHGCVVVGLRWRGRKRAAGAAPKKPRRRCAVGGRAVGPPPGHTPAHALPRSGLAREAVHTVCRRSSARDRCRRRRGSRPLAMGGGGPLCARRDTLGQSAGASACVCGPPPAEAHRRVAFTSAYVIGQDFKHGPGASHSSREARSHANTARAPPFSVVFLGARRSRFSPQNKHKHQQLRPRPARPRGSTTWARPPPC
jgi:hypothetical protein